MVGKSMVGQICGLETMKAKTTLTSRFHEVLVSDLSASPGTAIKFPPHEMMAAHGLGRVALTPKSDPPCVPHF